MESVSMILPVVDLPSKGHRSHGIPDYFRAESETLLVLSFQIVCDSKW